MLVGCGDTGVGQPDYYPQDKQNHDNHGDETGLICIFISHHSYCNPKANPTPKT